MGKARSGMPGWIRRPVRCGPALRRVEDVLEREGLNTVCRAARCPNRGECYSSGTATFMIMGSICTRDCAFCAVDSGSPAPLRQDEPEALARAAEALGLRHVVVTSVTRDDLPDGGASHFSRTVEAARRRLPDATVEVLVPDFKGDPEALGTVVRARPDVFNHNMETVRSLYPEIRPQAGYRRSLDVLKTASEAGLLTKSGFMVGLGETYEEVEGMLWDLRETGCRLVTVGQYLRPAAGCVPVERFWEPDEFDILAGRARGMGFEGVAAGPFVRSSYFAGDMLSALDLRTAQV